MNNYNVKTYTRTAVPRSQRLREVGMNAAQFAMQQAAQPELPSSLIKIIKDLDSWFGFDRDANAVYVKQNASGEDVNFYTYGQLAGGGFRSSGGSGGGGITAIIVNGTTFTPSPGSTVVTLDNYPTATSLGLKALAYKDTLAASDIPTLAISKISGLQSALDGKQAAISDLADIRSGAALGATAVQTIYALTLQAGAFSAGTYTPNSAAKTINIPTTTSHISEGSNLYFTNARALSATDGTYLKLTGGNVSGTIRSGNIFINNGYVFSLNRDGATGDIHDVTKHAFEIECYTDGVRLKEYFPNASYPLTLSSSNIGINTTSPSERLEVNGNIKTSGNIIIGNYILSVDSTAGALKLSKSDGTAAHFYTTGQMSAGGFSSSGGSGGGTVTAIKVNGTTYSPTTGTTVINLPDYPTATSLGLKALAYKASLTPSEVISYLGYTPLSTAGGTISGPITYSVAAGAYAYFLLGNTSGYSMRVGTESYYTNRSAALSYWNGSTLLGAIGVSSTGVPFFHDSANHILYHEGNFVAGTNYVTPSGLTSALSGYVSKSGGDVISGTTAYPLTLNTTNSANYLDLEISGTRSGRYGFNTGTIGVYLQNLAVTGTPYVNIASDGVFKYKNSYPFYHSGNFVAGTDYVSPSGLTSALGGYLPLSGGTMTGAITMPKGVGVVWSQSTDTDWSSARNSGIRILNTVNATATGSPTNYSVGLSVHGYYGFQLACGGSGNTFYMRGMGNGTASDYQSWVTLYHSGNSNNTSTDWAAKSFITGSQVSNPTGVYRGNTITTALTADDMVLWANGKKIGVWGDVEFKHSVVFDSALTASSHIYMGGYLYSNKSGSNRTVIDFLDSGEPLFGYGTCGAGLITAVYGNYIAFHTSTSRTERMRIDASGNVGIGTTSPSSKLSVFGDSYFQTNISGANIFIDAPTYTGGWNGGLHVYEQGSKVASIINWYANSSGVSYIRIGNFDSTYDNPAIYISSSRNVGIGDTSPSEKLVVGGNIKCNIIYPTGNATYNLGTSAYHWAGAYINNLYLGGSITGATSITATGTVTTGNHYVSNGYLFDVNRNGSTGAIYDSTKHALEIECYADSIRFKEYYPSASFPLTLASGSVGVNATTIPSGVKLYVSGNFAATGNVGAGSYTSSSDRKFKDNISLMTDEQAIALIKALKPSSWDWNGLSHIEGRGHGFVAQEVSPYLPESVKEIDGHLTLNYTDLHAFEVKALQCHESEIERLRKRVSELERKLTNC